MKAKKQTTWIVKPEDGAEGCGISLAKEFKDIP
jgi:rubredoxin